MVVHHRKKYRKYVGKRYARRGYNDRNRGNNGGKGFSQWRKKKAKYIKIIKEYPELLEDKKGFTSINYNREVKIINLYEIEEKFDRLLNEGIIKEEKGYYLLDLNQLGYDKLLSKGNISKKMKIIVNKASEKAVEKVKALGGEVILQ